MIIICCYLGDVGHDGPEREDVVVETAPPPPLGLQVLGLEPGRRRLPVPAALVLLQIIPVLVAPSPPGAAKVQHRRAEVLLLHPPPAAPLRPPGHCCPFPPPKTNPPKRKREDTRESSVPHPPATDPTPWLIRAGRGHRKAG